MPLGSTCYVTNDNRGINTVECTAKAVEKSKPETLQNKRGDPPFISRGCSGNGNQIHRSAACGLSR